PNRADGLDTSPRPRRLQGSMVVVRPRWQPFPPVSGRIDVDRVRVYYQRRALGILVSACRTSADEPPIGTLGLPCEIATYGMGLVYVHGRRVHAIPHTDPTPRQRRPPNLLMVHR